MEIVGFLINILHQFVAWVVNTVGQLGYTGIVVMMLLESSFIPFPSEVVLPPAGYLISQGRMSFFPVVASGILGSLLGALVNYWIAVKWGRRFFDRYGKLLKQLAVMSNGWNGTFNGYALPADDYWFHLNFENGKIIKGHFSLKR